MSSRKGRQPRGFSRGGLKVAACMLALIAGGLAVSPSDAQRPKLRDRLKGGAAAEAAETMTFGGR